jgi:hypothetical protein
MMMKQLAVAVGFAMLGTTAAFAVTPGADSPTAEGQKGAGQHDQSAQPSQPTTAQPSQSTTSESKDSSAGTGASSAPATGDRAFTQGESQRCATMTGADKEQCDKEEATKTEGPAAQDASGSSQGSSK